MYPARRKALRWLLAGGLAAVAVRAGYLAGRDKGPLGDADATAAASLLGQTFLAQAPTENNVDALSRYLLGVDLHSVTTVHPEEIRRRVLAAVQADFLAGDFLQIQGWVISRAEGRLGALIYLLGASET